MSDLEQYSRYFSIGMKVGVSIPLPNASVFRDWAIVQDVDEDLIALQLSRDMLPAHVTLRYGQILELRCGGNNDNYCCRAMIVSESDSRQLMLRLIGEIISDDVREFYRIDAFLPIKYFVSREQNVERLRLDWEERRVYRLRQKNHSWSGKLPSGDVELPHERLQEHDTTESHEGSADGSADGSEAYQPWETIIPLAANISGGGLRLITHQDFESGEYCLLEILVPSPQRVVDVVARVVFANRNYAAGIDREYFNTGMQFLYIDERDRDAIVTYISTIQLMRNRQLLEEYMFRDKGNVHHEKSGIASGGNAKKIGILIVTAIIMILIVGMLFNFFWEYAQGHPKGEIEQTFEGGIRKYRELHQ